MSKWVSQMLCDSVRSLVMCNLFSHGLFLSTWPQARSGFLLTLNMSEAEVSRITVTDTHSVQTKNNWTSGFKMHSYKYCFLFLLIDDSKSYWTQEAQKRDPFLRVDLDYVFKPCINNSIPRMFTFVDVMGRNLAPWTMFYPQYDT